MTMKSIWFFFFAISIVHGQVGINTTNPQQALHLSGADGTIRIEGLNAANNASNGGMGTYPLYVDENGDFTLGLSVLQNSEYLDAFDFNLSTTTVYLPPDDADGIETTTIKTYSGITVSRPTIIELHYSLSYDVYLDDTKAVITDNLSRRVQTYVNVTGQSREYGSASKVYASGSTLSVAGNFYNSSTAYITLPSAGTYEIAFVGLVDSGTKSGGGGSNAKETYVEFAVGNDFVFMRAH